MCRFCMSGRLLPAGPLAAPAARPARRRRRALRRPSASPLAARGTPPGLSGSARGRATARPFCASPRLAGSACGLLPARLRGRARAVAARARLPPASARCGAPVLASLAASGSRSAARGPPRASCGPSRALGGRSCPPRRGPPASPRLPVLSWRAAPPRAGALGPLCGPRGAAFRAPARWGLARCGARSGSGAAADAALPSPEDAPIRKVVQDFLKIPAREIEKAARKGGFSLYLII